MKKRILVLGSTGMLGHVLTETLLTNNHFEIFDLSYRKKLRVETIIQDIREENKIANLINQISPDIIINCIGILIKESSYNPKNAIWINSYFPHFLSTTAQKFGGRVIHVSTDCVFSGDKGPYEINDSTDAKDIYGKSKALGELINNQDLTLRTSIIGPELKLNGEGLLHWILNQKTTINGYKNVFWSGVTTLQLSNIINVASELNITGIYHIAPKEQISKFELLSIINDCFKLKLKIVPVLKPSSDKSLIPSKISFNDTITSYQQMVVELKEYMVNNKLKYTHYFPS